MISQDSTRSVFYYVMAMLTVAGSNFLIAPLLLKILGIEGFADWARLEPIILMALPLAGLGVQLGLLSLLRDVPDAANRLMPFHMAFAVIVAGFFGAVAYLMSDATTAFWISVIVLFEGGIVFMISFWRASNRPGWYASVEGGRSAAVMLVIFAIPVLPLFSVSDVNGYLALRACLGGVFFGLGLSVTRWRWQPDLALARRAVKYGLPIVVASMAVTLIMNFDRYVVDSVSGTTALAQYVAHTKTTQILGSALAPFFTWFAPVAIARLQTDNLTDGFFGRSFFAFMAVNFALGLGLWLAAPALWPLVFPNVAYAPSLMAALILGMVIFASGNPLSISSLREGSTPQALKVTVMAIVAGGIACIPLGRQFGADGVAWAKTLAMMVYTGSFAILTWRSLRISYPWGRVLLLGTIAFGIAILLGPIISRLSPISAVPVSTMISFFIIIIAHMLNRM